LVTVDYLPGFGKEFQFLEIKTSALEYIRKTVVYKASEILNQPGNYGFDRISVLVIPKKQGAEPAIYSPEFLQRVEAYSKRLAQTPDVRQVNSILDTMKVVARESYKRDMPADSRQAHDILQTIEWDIGPLVKEQLWFDRGIALFASTAKDDTRVLAAISENMTALAAREFPDLEVLPFGKMAIYPQADTYIREGKPINILTSQWMVVLAIVPWIIWRNRRSRHIRQMYGWRTGLVANIPFVFASGAIVLVMIAMRVPLDQATACITALAINAAVDFGLYLAADFQTAIMKGQEVRDSVRFALVDRGKVIVMDIVLNALCFVPLMLSTFQPVMRLGWIMIVMLVACGFGALVIMPALLPWCVRSQNEGLGGKTNEQK
jgi:predicted RND superfamily exporter protein